MDYAFHPEARLEYLGAADFYEQRRPGLGANFSLEIEAAIERILEAPTRWPVFEGDVRRCLTHRFPYGILYARGQSDFDRRRYALQSQTRVLENPAGIAAAPESRVTPQIAP